MAKIGNSLHEFINSELRKIILSSRVEQKFSGPGRKFQVVKSHIAGLENHLSQVELKFQIVAANVLTGLKLLTFTE